MKDLDSKLICEAYSQVVESDQLTWINTLANTFAAVGERSLVNVSKKQMKKHFQKYLLDSGIANDPAKVEMLDRGDDKGKKARQKLFMTVLQDLRALHGDREPDPIPEPEPESEPERSHPGDLDPYDDETLPPPEHQEPDPIPEPDEDDDSWLTALKKGKLRIPRWPGIKFKDRDGNTIS